jgi:hypothetical protein
MPAAFVWPEVLNALQDALRQAEAAASQRERDPRLCSSATGEADHLERLEKEIAQSGLARQRSRAAGLDALEALVKEAEMAIADSERALQGWMSQASRCSETLEDGAARPLLHWARPGGAPTGQLEYEPPRGTI